MADTANQMAERYIKTNLVPPSRQMNIATGLFNKVLNLPEGKLSVLYEKISEVGEALTTFGYPTEDMNRDMIAVTPYTKILPVTVKGIKMSREMVNAFASEGKDISANAIQSMLQMVGMKRDDILLTGWSKDGVAYAVEGMQNLTSRNAESTSSVTSTPGNMIIKTALMLDKLAEDSISGVNFNLTMARANYFELVGSILSGSGKLEFPEVERQINLYSNRPKGQIQWSNDLTANTCIMSPVDYQGTYMELAMGIDMDVVINEFGPLGKYNPIYAHCVDAYYPIFYDVNCICEGTGL